MARAWAPLLGHSPTLFHPCPPVSPFCPSLASSALLPGATCTLHGAHHHHHIHACATTSLLSCPMTMDHYVQVTASAAARGRWGSREPPHCQQGLTRLKRAMWLLLLNPSPTSMCL